mgnify:CR=1 FL=1
MGRRRYARRKYLDICDPDEVLTVKDVGKAIKKIIKRIPEGRIVTLNRILAECGYPYYTSQGIYRLVKSLEEAGLRVERASNRRYVVLKPKKS